MCVRPGVDQLGIDADLVAQTADASLEYVTYVQLAADLFRIDRLPPIGEGGIPRYHEHFWDSRQIRSQVLSDPVSKIFLIGIVAQVGERQNDDREASHRRCRGDEWPEGTEVDCVNSDRARDVLQLLVAQIAKSEVEFAGRILLHARRDADAAWLGQAFKTGCDDHPVAHQVVTFRHNLALMYANAKAQPVSLGTQHILDGDGTAQRLHRAGKLHEEAVAGGLEEPALMRGDERFYNVGAQSPHARQGARLICADHGRVADDIGRQDGGKTALLLAHVHAPLQREHKAWRFSGQSPPVKSFEAAANVGRGPQWVANRPKLRNDAEGVRRWNAAVGLPSQAGIPISIRLFVSAFLNELTSQG